MHRPIVSLLALAAALPAVAQSNVNATNKYAWQENCGWLNWRDANGGSQGARFNQSFAQGFVWGENIGWINLGDGTPVNGLNYANTTGADFGVNISASNLLSGLAWGENVGWINFGPFPGNPSIPQPRIDVGAGRLRGYAWGENIGWINLDGSVAGQFVSVQGGGCTANCDGSTTAPVLNALDFSCFLTRYREGLALPAAEQFAAYGNCDGSTVAPVLNALDFSCFLNRYRLGCP